MYKSTLISQLKVKLTKFDGNYLPTQGSMMCAGLKANSGSYILGWKFHSFKINKTALLQLIQFKNNNQHSGVHTKSLWLIKRELALK